MSVKLIFSSLVLLSAASSCAPVAPMNSPVVASSPTYRSTTSKRLDVDGTGIIQAPLVVDLDVKEQKTQGSASGADGSVEALKEQAVADATRKSHADMLVEPSYDINSHGGTTLVEVSGWPATYKNFRPLKESDLPLLQFHLPADTRTVSTTLVKNAEQPTPQVATLNGVPTSQRKAGAGGAVLLVLLAVGAAVALGSLVGK